MPDSLNGPIFSERYNKDFSLLIKSPLILSEDKLKVLNIILKKNESHKMTYNLLKVILTVMN